MPNPWFRFKQFKIWQEDSAFKVGTDGVLLGAWCSVESDNRVLDIGTGTGIIALMIAQRSEAQIWAVESDKSSADEAKRNVINSPWADRVRVHNNSLQNFADESSIRFDHIVSNPPYFTDSLKNKDSRKSSARHNFSLTATQLLKSSLKLLCEDGKLSLILPWLEGNLFIAEAADYSLYCNRTLKVKALPEKPVKRVLLEFSRTKKKHEAGFLIIEKGPRHNYTHEYRELTKDFYLDF